MGRMVCPETSESKEQGAHENPTKIARKNTKITHATLGEQILYKQVKNLNLWSREMRSSPEGWFAQKP
jgi:hypothetical protein